ncbi:MAG: glutathione S-transferase family protein [Hydrogenophaga sp.]
MIRLYYSPGSCSLASHIALEEAGAEFEVRRLSFADGEQKGEAYRKINPKGKVPALVDDEWVLTETPAILFHIARCFPAADLWPNPARESARCAEWLAWLSSTIHPAYSHVLRPERYAGPHALQDVAETARTTCRTLWATVDERLGAGPWALGPHYSVVDPYLFVIWTWGRPGLRFDIDSTCPNWTAHARRMQQRPAVRAALAREGLVIPGF